MELKTKLKEGEGEEHEKVCFGTALRIAKVFNNRQGRKCWGHMKTWKGFLASAYY